MTLQYDQAFATLKTTALDIKAERDRYEAALRKIAAWQGYKPAPLWFDSDKPLSEYETGANDMLETLAGFAKEALSP
jgi:hypothetical protein